MASFKNIILDLGGVLLDIDYKKTEQAFINLGFSNFREMYSQYNADDLFTRLETGRISNKAFYEYMITKSPSSITREQVRDAWNAMLLTFRVETLTFLKGLGARYKLYLLSNTNAIHLEAFAKILYSQTQEHSLDPYFEIAWYSHTIGLRKPNKDIFEFVLGDAGLQANETLFVDDSYNNIDTAKSLGLQTHLLKPRERLEDLPF